MNGINTRLPRAAAIVLIGGASFVAVIAIVLVTVLLKPLASTAVTPREVSMGPGSSLPALDREADAPSSDPESQGELPNRVTAFDEQYSGVTNIDPALLQALREASTAAAAEGITVYVNSGWRSTEYQEQLYREAVAQYGSEEEASRWVATADSSAHVSGNAVDVGDVDATSWLSQFGATYGLCQSYENEPWHYELRPAATTEGCPTMSSDAAIH